MSDVTDAPVQSEIADSLVEETTQDQPVEQTGTEQQVETEVVTQPVEQAEEIQEQTDEWLPGDQEKVFPDEILARYAQRYGLDEGRLSDPLIRQLIHDKINADIFIREQQQASPIEQIQDEPLEPTQEPAPLTRDQYMQGLDRLIQERTDPEVAKAFHADFLKAFGIPDSEIAKYPVQQALAFTHVASKYMLNLVNTFIDDMLSARLSNQLNSVFPGFGEMHERSSYAMAWDRVRNSTPEFQALPAYGTKEFSTALRTAAGKIPGFDEMQFTDPQGNPLPLSENAMRKYTMLAQIASGQNVDPALVARAAAAGAQNARRADVRRSAGNLGSGKSKAGSESSGSGKFQTNTDLFDDETMELYNREHGRV